MAVNYGVLRGKITDAMPYQHGTDHYQIEVNAGEMYRIAVDVYSAIASTAKSHYRDGKNDQPLETDRMVMFYSDTNYQHVITSKMLGLQTGLTSKADMPQDLLLDYLRYNPVLFDISQMKVLPPKEANSKGPDLNDDIDPWVQKAKNNDNAEVFAFGSSWDDNAPGANTPDKRQYFTTNPSLGIHDIHMNQGDVGKEAHNNGTWQDGALFIHFASGNGNEEQWVAFFFRFQNQSIVTDDNGNIAAPH